MHSHRTQWSYLKYQHRVRKELNANTYLAFAFAQIYISPLLPVRQTAVCLRQPFFQPYTRKNNTFNFNTKENSLSMNDLRDYIDNSTALGLQLKAKQLSRYTQFSSNESLKMYSFIILPITWNYLYADVKVKTLSTVHWRPVLSTV